ncbi:alpha-glucosidase/alpha-galactosidase [Candidatus Caldatribacterium sp.]|uniref:alpha-glucosidase/alpha-galactosidase n=1 Tax=Candidatus Caldatribacterium sp. TaxID=2282143 RepID=UPI00299264A4|nr:alpha-glucosidase/alpha-galactosidase [Candidatus Caldatribacterium sp.]MDW8080532.1 alpha-glucosidase/alpha-galactosidase [Candidatus Calescibacterium sp.]
MPKIVIIGAGSVVFAQKLITDILTFPALWESTLALVDIDEERLELITRLTERLKEQEHLPLTIEATKDRRKVLKGARYVINMIQVGGLDAYRLDVEIPRKYGIDQTVGDTLGPGGVFRALRTVPVVLEICRDIEELCPDALLINYTNPMAMLCWAISKATKVRCVGLCHSVQGTARTLAEYIGVEVEDTQSYESEEHRFFYKPMPADIDYWVAGINHQAWFLQFKYKGEDAYPLLWKAMEKPEIYRRDIVRFEIMRHFGYFVTESSHHMSEYVPYFRKNPESVAKYLPERWDYYEICRAGLTPYLERIRRQIRGEEPIEVRRSLEYGGYIINAMETGELTRVNGNVTNTGLIPNLPEGCCVEVPCLVDRLGVHPCFVGDLPPQLASINRTNINVQELAVEGILQGKKEYIYEAVALDPLVASVLTLDDIRRMVDEMFVAEREYLPENLRS